MVKYLFFGVFAAVGIGIFAFFSVPSLLNWSDAKSWQAANGQIESTELISSRSDGSTVYRVVASYRYSYNGVSHQGDRVGFTAGSDNVGSYHQDWHARLSDHLRSKESITVWVNPDKPSESVIDRDLRWGLLAFQSLFLFVFGGVGIGGIVYSFISDRNAKPIANHQSKPWLNYREWHQPTIYSNAQSANRFLLAFAVFWNLISIGGVFIAISEILEKNYLASIVLIFPFFGALLLYFWYRSHKAYRRVGKMPLTLNPYPASIGGQLGGTILIANPVTRAGGSDRRNSRIALAITDAIPDDTEVNLTCFETYRSNKKTHERVLWGDTKPAYWRKGLSEHKIVFCFDLPETAPVPDIPHTPDGKQWRLRLTATLQNGTSIERDYNQLPVFATQQTSSLSNEAMALAQSPDVRRRQRNLADRVLPIQTSSNGYKLEYPAYQTKSGLVGGLFGLIFVVAGVMIPSLTFNIIFPLIGGLVVLGGLGSFGSSLSVIFGREGITAHRTVFGIARKPLFLPSYSFQEFTKKKTFSQTSSQRKATQFYSIEARAKEGQKVTVAKNLKGLRETQAAIDKLNELVQY